MSADPLEKIKHKADTVNVWMNRITFILLMCCLVLTMVFFLSVGMWLHASVCLVATAALTFVAHKLREWRGGHQT